MNQVAIIVPVLSRPRRVQLVIDNVAATTSDYRLLFIATEGNIAEIVALEEAGADYIVTTRDRVSWAYKINDGFNLTTEPWIFTGADDLNFHPDWFPRALRWATETTGMIGTNDICNHFVMQGLNSTHSLFHRDYVTRYGTIDEPGKVLHEGYGHAFVDSEAYATANARGLYVHAYDAIVEHLHPLVKKAPDDETYRRGRKFSSQGKQLFAKRGALWNNPRKVRAAMVPIPDRAVVVTATYGNYDSGLRAPVPQDMPVDYICFTDQVDLEPPAPWKTVLKEPMFPTNPRMSAKVPKMLPDVGCNDVIWIDASHEITSPSFVREALASRQNGIAAFKHPRRSCAYDELGALLGTENQDGLYFHRPLEAQAVAYQKEGYPRQAGLFACGVLAWDLSHPRARRLGQDWLVETAKWSHQDQAEFVVVCHRLGIEPGVFPVDQIDPKFSRRGQYLGNPWFRIHRHVRPRATA